MSSKVLKIANATATAMGTEARKRSLLTMMKMRIGAGFMTANIFGKIVRTISSVKIIKEATMDAAATTIAAGIMIDPEIEEMTAEKAGETAIETIATVIPGVDTETVAKMIAERCQAPNPGEMKVP